MFPSLSTSLPLSFHLPPSFPSPLSTYFYFLSPTLLPPFFLHPSASTLLPLPVCFHPFILRLAHVGSWTLQMKPLWRQETVTVSSCQIHLWKDPLQCRGPLFREVCDNFAARVSYWHVCGVAFTLLHKAVCKYDEEVCFIAFFSCPSLFLRMTPISFLLYFLLTVCSPFSSPLHPLSSSLCPLDSPSSSHLMDVESVTDLTEYSPAGSERGRWSMVSATCHST